MTITNLKNAPHLYSETLSLIEKAFKYQKPHQFEVDFAPLISPSNHQNSFLKLNSEGNVIAHIGFCKRSLLNYPIGMLGGIAVDEKYRGEGHFNDLMQEIISEFKSDVAFFMLWSDQEKLYNKFGFYLCGSQFEREQLHQIKNYKKTLIQSLSPLEKEDIKDLYKNSFCKNYLSLSRTNEDWENLEKIVSSDLYIKQNNNKISDYFFMNKGQDLHDVIFEYGTSSHVADLLNEIRAYGKVWSAHPSDSDAEAQYQFFISPGDTRLFSSFIKEYTRHQISIREVNQIKKEVYFDFKEELLSLDIEEFLRGILGPAPFEELGDLPPIFISGLDSI